MCQLNTIVPDKEPERQYYFMDIAKNYVAQLAEKKGAVSQGVLGTPTIVVNGKRYAGIKPYYELKEIIENNER